MNSYIPISFQFWFSDLIYFFSHYRIEFGEKCTLVVIALKGPNLLAIWYQGNFRFPDTIQLTASITFESICKCNRWRYYYAYNMPLFNPFWNVDTFSIFTWFLHNNDETACESMDPARCFCISLYDAGFPNQINDVTPIVEIISP